MVKTKESVSKIKGFSGKAGEWTKVPRWVRVVSSNVARIKYDRLREVLHVEFKGSPPSEYVYIGVDQKTAAAMFNAPSLGRFVHRRLKGKYPYKRIN